MSHEVFARQKRGEPQNAEPWAGQVGKAEVIFRPRFGSCKPAHTGSFVIDAGNAVLLLHNVELNLSKEVTDRECY